MRKLTEKVASFLVSLVLSASLLSGSIRLFLPDKPPVTHKVECACLLHWAIFLLMNPSAIGRGGSGGDAKSPMPKPSG